MLSLCELHMMNVCKLPATRFQYVASYVANVQCCVGVYPGYGDGSVVLRQREAVLLTRS